MNKLKLNLVIWRDGGGSLEFHFCEPGEDSEAPKDYEVVHCAPVEFDHQILQDAFETLVHLDRKVVQGNEIESPFMEVLLTMVEAGYKAALKKE